VDLAIDRSERRAASLQQVGWEERSRKAFASGQVGSLRWMEQLCWRGLTLRRSCHVQDASRRGPQGAALRREERFEVDIVSGRERVYEPCPGLGEDVGIFFCLRVL